MSNNKNLSGDFYDSVDSQSEGFSIDFKRVLSRALRYWYFVLLSLLIALGLAYLKNRYSTRIYPVKASILIKEMQENSEGKLLYNNPLVSYYRNYLNEPYIIKSYPLVQQVIKDLKFDLSFYQEGNILTSEAYDYVPVDVGVLAVENGILSRQFNFTILNEESYRLGDSSGADSEYSQNFHFNDTVFFQQFKLVISLKKLDRGIDSYKDKSFILTYRAPHLLTNTYLSMLGVSWAEQGAGVINLSINGANPAKEIDFLNGLIRSYQQYDYDKKSQSASRTIDFINEQLASISDSLHHVELQVERFKDKNIVTNLSDETQRLYQKVEEFEIEKARILIRQNYYKYVIDYIEKVPNLDQVILPTSVGVSDQILSGLLSRMIDIQLQLKSFDTGKLEIPAVSRLKNQLSNIKQDIVESVHNQQSTDQIQIDFLNHQIHNVEQELGRLPVAESQYAAIQRNYSLLENIYIFLMQKRAEASISKASTTSDIVVINPPMVDGGPISPRKGVNYTAGALAGLGLPLLIFLILELLNNKIQSREDIQKITDIPFLGGIGHKESGSNLVVLEKPKSYVAESFRALRSNLQYFTNGREKSVFMISSSISGEGKTFTTINLSIALALSGKSVLIVGADLRRPRIFEDFRLNNSIGLSSVLANLASFDEVLQVTIQEGLYLISGGPVPPNPSELLLSKRMEEFMHEAIHRFDYVLLDTPPIGVVTDAFALSKFVDHIVFVTRQNYTPKNLIKSIGEYYNTERLTKISVVLNDIQRSGPGYGYGYGYYYGYGKNMVEDTMKKKRRRQEKLKVKV